MRLVSVLVLLGALGLCTGAAFADPNAKPETEPFSFDFGTPRAIVPEVEPNNTCPGQIIECGDVVDPAQILASTDVDWYRLLNVAGGTVITVGTDASALGDPDVVDSYVELYYNCSTTRVAYDDDGGPGAYSLMTYVVPAGSPGNYDIKVRGYSASYIGFYKMSVSCAAAVLGACCVPSTGACTITLQTSCVSPNIWHSEWTVCTPNPCPQPILGACCATTGVCTLTVQTSCLSPSVWQGANTVCNPNPCPGSQPAPVNDLCSGAIAIARCTTGTLTGDLTWAFDNYTTAGATGCTGYPAVGRDVVYVVTLQAGDVLHLVYNTPIYDGSIYVITDCANPTTTCVVGEDDPEPETITWTALTGGTYYIIADAYSGGAAFTLDYTITGTTGSCCYLDGTCAVTLPTACTGIFTACGVCEPNTCAQPAIGSCCYLDGTCAVTTQTDCTATWTEAGVCVPNPCPPPSTGSCCSSERTCTVTTQALCAGTWTEGGDCDPDPCVVLPPTGSCCYVDGTCAVTTLADCTATWLLDGVCVPNTCEQPPPPMGSCCFVDGTCAVTTLADCTATWLLGGVCVPNTCVQPPPLGACCDHATGGCTITIQTACQFDWLGAGVPCDLTTCAPPIPVERTSWGQIKNLYR